MKGKLYRKTEGWMVFYVEKNSAYTSTSYQKSLPLHPDNSTVILYEKHPLDWDGKEVDFEIVNESWDGYKGCTYAKLINQVPDVRKMVEDDVEKFALKYIDDEWSDADDTVRFGIEVGVKIGYNKAKETLYTEEQLREVIEDARDCTSYVNTDEVIRSLKQHK